MMRTSSACAALWLVALSGHLAGCIGIEPPARDDVVESAVTTSTTTIPYNICENFDVCRMRDAPVTVLAGLPVIGHPDDEVCVLSGVGGVKTNVGPNFAFAELGRIGRPGVDSVCTVTDTLMMAREIGRASCRERVCNDV